MSETINWSQQSLEELEDIYWQEIAPARERDDHDPTTSRPSYDWLVEHGYSGIAYALREHHDLTVKQFFNTVVGLNEDEMGGFEWGIDNEQTREQLEEFIDSRMRQATDGKLTTNTVTTKRSRLAAYVRLFEKLHGDANLVEEVSDPDNERDAYDRALAVFRELQDTRKSEASVLRIHEVVDEFYYFLDTRRIAQFNPVRGIASKHELGLSRETETKPALSAGQVGRIYDAAETTTEELIVIGLAGLGLRRSEVASLHISQIHLGDDPHVRFAEDERKNKAGEVTIFYGADALANRIDDLDGDDWNGYLFPSTSASTGHITGETVNNRFQRIAHRADVRLHGEEPTSHACRRFWYQEFSDVMGEMLEMLEDAAKAQGASSAEVVDESYNSDERRRQFRKRKMGEHLAAAFESRD